jgi:hypothetical protein
MLSIPIVSQFDNKGIKNAVKGFKQLETTGQKASFLLKAGMAAGAAGIAAVGAAALTAGKMLWEFAQMARADQLAQVQLAGTLRATTKATDEQIKAIETWIDTTARATGVADDELRPAYARLAKSTKNNAKTQNLLNLALNISGRTGKPLQAVVNGLAKAYEGSNTALNKLQLGYSKAELKAKDFSTIQKELEKQYAGGASEKANTFEGSMSRLKIALDELKEAAGAQLLEPLKKVADAGTKIAEAFGKKGMSGALQELRYQLKLVLYDEQGNLNEFGTQLNALIKIYDLFAKVSNATKYAPGSLLESKLLTGKFVRDSLPTIDTFDQNIDRKSLAAGQLRNVYAAGGFGQTATGLNSKPTTVVNVTVSPLTDPAAVGKEIDRVLALYGRRSGKR